MGRHEFERYADQALQLRLDAATTTLAKEFDGVYDRDAQSEGRMLKSVPQVVFVSLAGGGRAQIGAAILSHRVGEAVEVHCAGSGASTEIEDNVRTALSEVGIDLGDAFARPLTSEVLAGADVVVTMGRSVGEVSIPETARHVDWRVGDPAGADLEEVRRVREDIERRVPA